MMPWHKHVLILWLIRVSLFLLLLPLDQISHFCVVAVSTLLISTRVRQQRINPLECSYMYLLFEGKLHIRRINNLEAISADMVQSSILLICGCGGKQNKVEEDTMSAACNRNKSAMLVMLIINVKKLNNIFNNHTTWRLSRKKKNIYLSSFFSFRRWYLSIPYARRMA